VLCTKKKHNSLIHLTKSNNIAMLKIALFFFGKEGERMIRGGGEDI